MVLVGLASKNAILIVEFAKHKHEEGGLPRREATLAACQLRLRPILMTSFAFILGVVPLLVSTGAGAEMRKVLGTAVFSGMLGVTLFGIFLTPVFFYVIEGFVEVPLFSSERALQLGRVLRLRRHPDAGPVHLAISWAGSSSAARPSDSAFRLVLTARSTHRRHERASCQRRAEEAFQSTSACRIGKGELSRRGSRQPGRSRRRPTARARAPLPISRPSTATPWPTATASSRHPSCPTVTTPTMATPNRTPLPTGPRTRSAGETTESRSHAERGNKWTG